MNPRTQLAIIGGGQLGMFLCQAAQRLEVSTQIVTPDPGAPALGIADQQLVADLERKGLGSEIAEYADIVTFEFEDVPDILLDELEALETAGRLITRPAVATLRLLKNKATQKSWLEQEGFPTLPFAVESEPAERFDELVKEFGLPFMQKAQTGGYDGYGVQVVPTGAGSDAVWAVPSVIEQYIERPTELGVVVARSADGELRAYPPVRMAFNHELNILDAVVQPTGFSSALEGKAVELASDLVARLDGVGIFAVEMFLDGNEQLLINEVAPRVHNSGHITLDTESVSQFEQHVRAVCGLSLGVTDEVPPAGVMRNLLGHERLESLAGDTGGPRTFRQPGATLYWYGKSEVRAGRKMGHINILTSSVERSALVADQLIDSFVKESSEAAA